MEGDLVLTAIVVTLIAIAVISVVAAVFIVGVGAAAAGYNERRMTRQAAGE